jgi:hypothetical protein
LLKDGLLLFLIEVDQHVAQKYQVKLLGRLEWR